MKTLGGFAVLSCLLIGCDYGGGEKPTVEECAVICYEDCGTCDGNAAPCPEGKCVPYMAQCNKTCLGE